MGYRKILIPLDGSKLAEEALQHALQIVDSGAHIHLLSVMAPDRDSELVAMTNAVGQRQSSGSTPKQWPPVPQPNDPRIENARQTYLKQVGEWLEQADYHVETEVRISDSVIDTILDVARDRFDAIIMATHGRSETERKYLSSVTQGVLNKAACPVLVIRYKEKK